MIRLTAGLLLLLIILPGMQSQPSPRFVMACDLSKDYGAYRDQWIAVRGVYYYGLRQTCEQKCADRPWPSFIDLAGARNGAFDALGKVEREVERKAKQGKRYEIWVTAVGRLKTEARLSPLGPCDKAGSRYFGYGHLGAFPAQLVVESFHDIEVRENPDSEYDYANMHHGAL